MCVATRNGPEFGCNWILVIGKRSLDVDGPILDFVGLADLLFSSPSHANAVIDAYSGKELIDRELRIQCLCDPSTPAAALVEIQ